MEKRRQRLVGEKYRSLDTFYRSFLFEATDDIFQELDLKLVLLDIDPSHCTETWDIEIRKGLIKNLKTNNSLLIEGDRECPFIEDTIVGETDILPFIQSRRACQSAAEEAEYRQAADEYIEASVVLGDQRRNLLLLLGVALGQLHFKPVMGAAVSLTGVEGETELRWGFSNLQCGGSEQESCLRDELEGVFAYRLLAEGMFLEDLRVARLSRRHGIVRSDRTKRFVSIVSSDMFLFPKGFVKAFLNMEGLSRHYNLSSALDLRHGPLCRCRRMAELAVQRAPFAEPAHTPSVSRTAAPNSIARSGRAGSASEAASPKKGSCDRDKVWSFYGISMFNFDRLLKAVYESGNAKNGGCRAAIYCRQASVGMRDYLHNSSSCWAQKN